MTFQEILDLQIIQYKSFELKMYSIIVLITAYIAVKILLSIIKFGFSKRVKLGLMDQGSSHSIFQICRYIIWIIAILLVMESVGIKITILLAGSAALLVGIGLGLQNTFNDFISGVILLMEGTIRVKDVIEIEGTVVIVQHIGIRTSKVINRDDISIIVPNSILTNNRVINWSHNKDKTRFKITVGVAYGSDIDLVMKLMVDAALTNEHCNTEKKPVARLGNFGDSSLDFDLFFWSENLFRIEQTLADIRAEIVRSFRRNKVEIPFPQRDLHLRSGFEKTN